MGLQRSEKCPKGIERCERRRNYRPVTRILYGGGGGGGANEAKVDQTTEMYFILSDPFI